MNQIKFLVSVAAVLFTLSASAQQTTSGAAAPFHGAKAELKAYKAVYQLNTDEDKKIAATLKNINNALGDPRLAGKLQVELVVHGAGVAAFKKNSAYEQDLLNLQKKGVILAQCENTLIERNISKDELYGFLSFVPSGNGELIIRQAQGWAIIHP